MMVGLTKRTASLRRPCRGRCELLGTRTTLATRTTLRSTPHEPGLVKTRALRFALPFVRSDGRRTHLPSVQPAALAQPRHLLFGCLQATRFSAALAASCQPGCNARPPASQAPAATRCADGLGISPY